MIYYVIKDETKGEAFGRFRTLEAARTQAEMKLLTSGVTEFLVRFLFKEDSIVLCHVGGGAIFTCERYCNDRAAPRVLAPKPYKLSGRTSVTGWYASPVKVELDLTRTAEIIGGRKDFEFYAVYMGVLGQPLHVQHLKGVKEEVTARYATNRGKRGRSSGYTESNMTIVARQMALSMLLEGDERPSGAVVLWVVHTLSHPNGLTVHPNGKRLLSETSKDTNFQRQALDLKSAWSSLQTGAVKDTELLNLREAWADLKPGKVKAK